MRDNLRDGLAIASAITIALLLKVPLLYNADALYTSDEANAGLLIKQLLDRGELSTHIWGTSYAGILEQLLAVPFVKTFGFSALSFKLAPTVIFSIWIWITYLLGKKLGGRTMAILSSTILACSPPVIVYWSQDFGGSLTVTHCLGALAFYLLHRSIDVSHTNRSLLAAQAFVLGLGLYANTLFIVYLVPIGLHYLLGSSWWAALRPGRTKSQPQPLTQEKAASPLSAVVMRRSSGATVVVCTVAFLIGFAPKLYHVVWEPPSIITPQYRPASLLTIRGNVRLLLKQCLPSLMGFNPFDDPEVAHWTGNPSGSPILRAWSLVALTLIIVAFLTTLVKHRRELLQILGLRPSVISVPAQMLILIFIVPAAFVFSTHPANIHSNHYLIPLYTALPVVIGTGLMSWSRFGRSIPLCAAIVLTGFYLAGNARFDSAWNLLTTEWRLQRLPDPWQPLVAYLDQQGIRGGYGSYWLTYRTTFASNERIVVAPYPYAADWDRYPRYTQHTRSLQEPAYLFLQHEEEELTSVKLLLMRRGISYVEKSIGQFVILHSAGATPFYNYLAEPAPTALSPAAFRVEFVKYDVPPEMKPGQTFYVPVTIRNASDQRWPGRAYYRDTRYRVHLVYHWANPLGQIVIYNGVRSPLGDDLGPGEKARAVMKVVAPTEPGRYRLILTLVQELVNWYDYQGENLAVHEVDVHL